MARLRRTDRPAPTVDSVYTLAANKPHLTLRVGDVWIRGSNVWNVGDAVKPDWVTRAESYGKTA